MADEPLHDEWQPYVYTHGGKRRVVSSRVQSRYHESGRQFSPRIWRGIYIVGKVLTAFLFRALEDFIYVFIRPFLPGRYGQCGTPVGEVIHRGALFCWFLVLIIIGLPLALIGCILRVVAVSAGKRDFTFVRPRGAPLQPPSLADDEEITITLRTQNIGFLPTVSPANGLATPMKRVRALLADLRSGLDDVVCLQEEFDLDVCDYLLSHLHDDLEPSTSAELSLMDEDDVETASLPQNKDRSSSSSSFHGNRISAPGKYGWMVMDVDGKAYRLNSGLFVASRYPLEAPEFVRYHICTNEDVLAGKGVLACTVVVGETSTGQKIKITIFTTHAQAGRQRRAARVREIQYEMVMHFIDYYNRKHIGPDDILVSSIFMGDFNFSPIMPRPSAITGKLVTCLEWQPNKTLFHKHHFVNNFYEHSRDGEKRARNRELIFQIQDLFHAEGVRLLLERRAASLPHPTGHAELEELSSASGFSSETTVHIPLDQSGGKRRAEQLESPPGSEGESDSEDEDDDEDDDEEDEWNETTYGGEGSSEGSSNAGLGRVEEKVWKMDIATLLKVLQVWAERRAQAATAKAEAASNADAEEQLGNVIKAELVRQLRVRKRVFVAEDEVNVRGIVPLAMQLRLVPRVQDESRPAAQAHGDSSKGKEKADGGDTKDRRDSSRREPGGGGGGGGDPVAKDLEMAPVSRKRADTGTGIWAGAYEPLIPGTILDTRKYAGKFSQRVRFNDIDHVLMKKYMPGRSVSVTKGRISIVWEGVNTFSDHYGKRLTLKLNVAQLVAKRNKQADRKRKGSSFHKEKDDEKHSTKHERRPEEDDGADDDDNDG